MVWLLGGVVGLLGGLFKSVHFDILKCENKQNMKVNALQLLFTLCDTGSQWAWSCH